MKFTDKEMQTNKWFTYQVNPDGWVPFSKKRQSEIKDRVGKWEPYSKDMPVPNYNA